MGIESIDTGEKLFARLKQMDSERGRIVKTVDELHNIFKSGDYLRKANDEGPVTWSDDHAAGFGKIVRDCIGNRNKIIGEPFDAIVEKTALGTMLTSDSSTGSNTVGVQYIADIIKLAEYKSDLRPYVQIVKMNTRTAVYPEFLTGFDFTYRSSETSDVTEQNPTFTTTDMRTYDYSGYIPMSLAFVEDNLVNIGLYMRELISGAMARKFDAEFLTGSGSPTTGILENGTVQVVRSGSTSFAGIDADDLLNMLKEISTKEERKNAAYIMHPTIADIVFGLRNANGDYIFRGNDLPVAGYPGKLFGKKIIYSDEMPDSTDDAADTAFVALIDPKRFLFGDRQQLMIEYLPSTMYKAQNLEVLFLAWFRSSFNVTLPASGCILKTAA